MARCLKKILKQKKEVKMKSFNLKSVTAIILISFLFIKCSESLSSEPLSEPILRNNTGANLQIDLSSFPFESVSDVEKEGLMFMREEEKLARDIYAEMNSIYNVRIFQNIGGSEQTHMNSVKALLDKYSIEDPVSEDVHGIFVNTELQSLFQELLAQGKTSFTDALKVGAIIEEVDIIDLIEELSNAEVDNQDIRLVYNNLLKGSANHLRAFVKNLSANGINYTPQYLSADLYEKIMTGQL